MRRTSRGPATSCSGSTARGCPSFPRRARSGRRARAPEARTQRGISRRARRLERRRARRPCARSRSADLGWTAGRRAAGRARGLSFRRARQRRDRCRRGARRIASFCGDPWEWMGPGGFRRLQNDCDLTTSGLVGSIPMHSRHLQPRLVRLPVSRSYALHRDFGASLRSPCWAVRSCLAGAPSRRMPTARRWSVRTTPTDSARKMLPKPPLSPRRAFLYSLAFRATRRPC